MSEQLTKALSRNIYESLEEEIEMNQCGIHLISNSYYDNASLI